MAMSVGKRKRGRPKRRWSECNREELESIGAVPTDAADRSKWSLVCTGDPAPATPHQRERASGRRRIYQVISFEMIFSVFGWDDGYRSQLGK